MTQKEIFAAQKLLIEENPLNLVEEKFLKIKTKDAQLQFLALNPTQKFILQKIQERKKEKKPLRFWILKARQEGVSTIIEAIVLAFTSQRKNINSLIIADEKEHANNLFEMSKLFHEELERDFPHLAPKIAKSNEKKLEFAEIHSQIIIATAENVDAARSHTFQLVHLSEVAFFRDFAAVMLGLMQSVPSLPETIIIGETTANGRNQWSEEWEKAIKGETDWCPIFIPWFALPEYSLSLGTGNLYPLSGINFGLQNNIFRFIEEEERLKQKYNLTPEQINWRRYAIVNKCGGDCIKFKQEYPSCWEEAFQVSGKNFFDINGLNLQIPEKPQKVGEIFYIGLKYEFREMPAGRIKIYTLPEKFGQYIVASDASEGIGVDEASGLVLNKRTNETSAVANGQYAPEELAELCIALGNFYNNAIVVPENKGYGYMVCQTIFKKYGNIYRNIKTKTGEPQETPELGFNTNSVTRPEYLAMLNEEIKHAATDLKDADLISQCRTFVINPKNLKAEALPGKQDGLVICRAIAGKVRSLFPYRPQPQNSISRQKRLFSELSNVKNGGFGF